MDSFVAVHWSSSLRCFWAQTGQLSLLVGRHRLEWQLPDLMDDFVNYVNRKWTETAPLVLAAFVLWRLNRIHPFINGNGRTARAACLFVICVSAGGWLPYAPILPEKIRANRGEYIEILQGVDKSAEAGNINLQPLVDFLQKLLQEQTAEA
ncbi:MAG: Fic family protein [Marinosulfonomonas sp.]|nr:Fic family protein [Marinosulfonomonas sp.]